MGSAEAIAGLEITERYRRVKAAQFSFSVACVAGVVGLMALLLWLRNQRQMLLLWLALAMVFPVATYFLVEGPETVPFRVAYALIGPLVAINDMAMWFLLIALLGLKEHRRLVRWTWILALTAIGLDLVDTICQFLTGRRGRRIASYGSTWGRRFPRSAWSCGGLCWSLQPWAPGWT
jgi:drug/metabolite transporter superfamily protein YnfA